MRAGWLGIVLAVAMALACFAVGCGEGDNHCGSPIVIIDAGVYTPAHGFSDEFLDASNFRVFEDAGISDECAYPTEGEQPTSDIGRDADPIVLDGKELALLVGRDPERLVAFRYTDTWERIPVQVDERKTIAYTAIYNNECLTATSPVQFYPPAGYDTLVYADVNTTVGTDPDPSIDDDDEVVVMLKDAGEAPESYTEPEGVEAGSGVWVDVSERDGGESLGTFYFFTNDGSLSAEEIQSYGTYTYALEAGIYPDDYKFCGGKNPEDSWFRSAYYERHFSDRWIDDVIKITAPGASGVDILDIHSSLLGWRNCASTVEGFSSGEGAFATNKSGPVRSIRSYLGASSGPTTQRTHLFYERREDIITDLRAHTLPGVMDYLDYSPEAAGMKYYNCFNPEGATIDGSRESLASGRLTPSTLTGNNGWDMVTGKQGSLVIVYKAHTNIEYVINRVYRDESPASIPTCVGDDSFYGASGVDIESSLPSTDPGSENYLANTRIHYYLEPGISIADARQLALYAHEPLVVSVRVAGR